MPHLFTCPHCQTKTQVEDRYSGQSGECVTCGGAIKLPAFAGGTSTASPKRSSNSMVRWLIASSVAVFLLGCLTFAIVRVGGVTMNRLTSNRDRTTSQRNLEKIAEALNAYAADHGTYPPPATRSANNMLMHSWRVLILPYLGEEDLYSQYDLTLPWSDPKNMQISHEVPAVFRHPNTDRSRMFSESAYYLVVGQGTLFPNSGPLGPADITDQSSQTILVVEGKPLVPSGMWIEPVDLNFSKMSGSIGGSSEMDPGGLFEDGMTIATADGRGHFVAGDTDPQTLQALITPKGGERLPDDTLD